MYIKDNFGNVGEAFNLIMRKEFAYQIIKGEKKLEFRALSDHYCSQFFKKSRPSERKDPDYFVPKDIGCVHFHDYNNTWFLDTSIEAVDIIAIHPDNLEYLHKYGHYEYDNEIAKLKERNVGHHDKEVYWTIAMPITGIINTNLDLSNIPGVMAYSIPEDCIITDPKALAEAELQFSGKKVRR